MENNNTIRTFLMNDQRDVNGLRYSWESIKKTAKNWIGIPGILNRKCDSERCTNNHTLGKSLQEAQLLSSQKKVTEIIDVQLEEASHTAYAIHNVISSEFAKLLCAEKVGYVSQSGWLDKAPKDPNHIDITEDTKYTPLHLAFVDDPAYGIVAKTYEKPVCTTLNNNLLSSSSMDEEAKTTEPMKSEDDPSGEDIMKQLASEVHEMYENMKSQMEAKGEEEEEEEGAKQDSAKKYNFSWPATAKSNQSEMLDDLLTV